MAEEEHTESFTTAVGTKTRSEGTFPIIPCSLFGGHLGRNRTLARLSHRFYWSGMSDDVKEWLGFAGI